MEHKIPKLARRVPEVYISGHLYSKELICKCK